MAKNGMADLDPELAALIQVIARGRSYADDTVDLKTRALCTVSCLVGLGEQPYIETWVANAITAGATVEEIASLMKPALRVRRHAQIGHRVQRARGGARSTRGRRGRQLDERLLNNMDTVEVAYESCAEIIERCYAEGWTDGLPVVPATTELVDRCLAELGWNADDVLFHEPVRHIDVPAGKVVVNAILAGCLPPHIPVVAAALRAMEHPDFRANVPVASTGGAAPVLLVNGPARDAIGLNCGGNLFGPGHRANAVIGRALRLILLNCLGATPGVLDLSIQGWTGKYTCCFGENESLSPWAPFHVRRGFEQTTSTVTVLACESPHNVLTRVGDLDADTLLYCAASVVGGLGSHSNGQGYLILSPQHARVLADAGYDARSVQEHLFEASRRSIAELKRSGRLDGRVEIGDDSRTRPRGETPDDILLAVGGSENGCCSAWFPSWSRGRGSIAVTAEIAPDGVVLATNPGPTVAPGTG
jgi:alkylhydroperoxidase/carboxymuconolactone decarboxylase family protein YurZ